MGLRFQEVTPVGNPGSKFGSPGKRLRGAGVMVLDSSFRVPEQGPNFILYNLDIELGIRIFIYLMPCYGFPIMHFPAMLFVGVGLLLFFSFPFFHHVFPYSWPHINADTIPYFTMGNGDVSSY